MNSLKERIDMAMQERPDIKAADIARACGVKPPSVSDWLSGKTKKLAGENLLSLANFLGVSAVWLATGKGLMKPARNQKLPDTAPTASQDTVEVQLFNATASMGLGRAMPEHETVVDVIRLAKSWVHSNLAGITSARNIAALTAYGDSMSPTFSDGDILLVDRGVTELKLDAVYVLSLNQELYVKRIQRRITDGAVIIKSDNPVYESFVVSNGQRENLAVLGRVMWAWNGRKL